MSIARASIKRRAVVLFLCALIAISGVVAYFQIGKLEDPTFTIKTAVVTAVYPGASAYEVEREVVSRIEDAVQAMGEIKKIRSHCMPGLALIYVDIKDQYTTADLPQVWNVLRQKLHDVQPFMPAGSTILIDNDFVVPNVASVKILGEQKECVYVEFSTNRLSSLGLSPQAIFQVLNQQNALTAIGSTTTGGRYVRVSPTSAITSVDDIADLVIGGAGGKLIRLREVATVRRDYADPQSFMLRFNGRPALGLGIATVPGGNVVEMGRAVSKRLRSLEAHRPIGMELRQSARVAGDRRRRAARLHGPADRAADRHRAAADRGGHVRTDERVRHFSSDHFARLADPGARVSGR